MRGKVYIGRKGKRRGKAVTYFQNPVFKRAGYGLAIGRRGKAAGRYRKHK